jgi:hypothetical protein
MRDGYRALELAGDNAICHCIICIAYDDDAVTVGPCATASEHLRLTGDNAICRCIIDIAYDNNVVTSWSMNNTCLELTGAMLYIAPSST